MDGTATASRSGAGSSGISSRSAAPCWSPSSRSCFTLVLSLTRPVVDGADAFMGALKDGQYEQAYARAAPSLQQELGDANGLAARIGPYRPQEWSWSQRKLRNGIGNVSGRATWQSGNSGTAEIELHQVNGEWRVVAFRFN